MTELRVMVCDDDDELLELMLRRLEGMGLELDRTEDGAAAQALIKEDSDARFAADAGVTAEA
jgi:CheY-like chemotaxis protein